MIKSFCSFLLLISFCSCQQAANERQLKKESSVNSLKYAKRFRIKKESGFTVLELLGNKSSTEVTATFVVYTSEKPSYHKEAYYIKAPVGKVASMSSIYSTMLIELGCGQAITAIDNVDYYTNDFIQQGVRENRILELSKGPFIEVEKTLALKPDLLITFGMGDPKQDADKKLVASGLPIAISLDHLEETPLARAEWIKFMACFFNKEALADSLFSITEKNYHALTELTKKQEVKPTVLTEIKYGDAWYVPSGKSYVASLIADAGGSYLWADEPDTGSKPLTFEMVYAKAKDVDIWINIYTVNTKKELTSYDERYSLFKAYKENHLYNNNKVQNQKGFSNYWETGITNPDEVLADLIAMFHPSVLPGHSFKFYKKIE